MTQLRYVVVEGPIASGKAALARRLAEHWAVRLLTEAAEQNPFLERFYRNPPHHGLATQLSFLLQRADAAHDMLNGDLLAAPLVADFLFEKDALFAELTLEDDELALYRRIAPAVLRAHPVPDLVIYLQASPETVQQRLEQAVASGAMSPLPTGYVQRVHAAYSTFFHAYEGAPLLIVNTDHLDLVEGDDDFGLLLRCISEMRGQRSYFNKGI
ncbi:deoxynucleoside kinase [Vogesella alkaliphila]|uniref:Deoxyguanosine kinase/deoxyadenosine kinase n=1 Tax=Vogesella alkaliphila TaxID=1193621 RepID=A0ABQ2YEY3_9NEIS|nr:deoxynucleoside kinase [Vogesella alkaliphila]GGX79902.1 deoxyguanosine kinase/deoxyadenosine kinase [Vogesella alkaliphila]